MKHSFWLLAFPLYIAWYCLGHLSTRAASRPARAGLLYLGALFGTAGVLLPVPLLVLCWRLPTLPSGAVALGVGLLLGGILHWLVSNSSRRYSAAELRRGLLWTTDISVLGWLLYGTG